MEDKNLLESLIADNNETTSYTNHNISNAIRDDYPQDRVEALFANFIEDLVNNTTNEEHLQELKDFLAYRKTCKETIKSGK